MSRRCLAILGALLLLETLTLLIQFPHRRFVCPPPAKLARSGSHHDVCVMKGMVKKHLKPSWSMPWMLVEAYTEHRIATVYGALEFVAQPIGRQGGDVLYKRIDPNRTVQPSKRNRGRMQLLDRIAAMNNDVIFDLNMDNVVLDDHGDLHIIDMTVFPSMVGWLGTHRRLPGFAQLFTSMTPSNSEGHDARDDGYTQTYLTKWFAT